MKFRSVGWLGAALASVSLLAAGCGSSPASPTAASVTSIKGLQSAYNPVTTAEWYNHWTD